MNPHLVTISALSVPRDGFTHKVVTPAARQGIRVGSIADARKVAAAYRPHDGRPVEIHDKTRAAGPLSTPAKQAARAVALGLRLTR
ncbi:hypothetical protein [Luteolibacter marinus]|uniref:hypothetical protein n=1 Tax=Luteolibacter marinus TaxID=2776705 RepID=UPI00186703AF|nr:hypothetical protein [Luteolibacter marinus]